MKDTYNLSYIVNRYKDNLSELKNVIKLKEISSHKSKIAEEDNIYNCDINLLVDALSIVKADYYRKLLIHSIPIIISVYFILSEIYYLDRNLASVRSDTYLNNINSSIYLVKTSIIFFIIPAMLIERLINNALRLDTEFFPYKLFYNLLCLLITILIIIKFYEIV